MLMCVVKKETRFNAIGDSWVNIVALSWSTTTVAKKFKNPPSAHSLSKSFDVNSRHGRAEYRDKLSLYTAPIDLVRSLIGTQFLNNSMNTFEALLSVQLTTFSLSSLEAS